MRLCRSQGCIPAGLKERVGDMFGHSFLARSTRDIWRLSDFLPGPHCVLDLARGGGGRGGGGGEWNGARVFVACSTSGLAATLKPREKEEIFGELGEWVVKRRREREEEKGVGSGTDGGEDGGEGIGQVDDAEVKQES